MDVSWTIRGGEEIKTGMKQSSANLIFLDEMP